MTGINIFSGPVTSGRFSESNQNNRPMAAATTFFTWSDLEISLQCPGFFLVLYLAGYGNAFLFFSGLFFRP
jgi:hypothetical protein